MVGEGESEKKESERIESESRKRERERHTYLHTYFISSKCIPTYIHTRTYCKYIHTYTHTYTLVMSLTSKGSETNEASVMGKLGISK
jgi:hypothetical protein